MHVCCHGHQSVSHFLITLSDWHDISDRVDQCDGLWDVQMVQISWDYIMMERRRKNLCPEIDTVFFAR